MNQLLPKPALPRFPDVLLDPRGFQEVRESARKTVEHVRKITLAVQDYLERVQAQLNTQVQTIGATLASAPTLTISAPIHHVTGTATISTINPPSGFSGPIWLIADGAWSTDTAGNISAAVTAVPGEYVLFVFDNISGTWFPFGGGGSSAGQPEVVSVSGTYAALDSDVYILADPTAGGFTVTIPTPTGNRFLEVKNIAAVNDVTVGASGANIEGALTQTVTPGSGMAIVTAGTDWWFV